MLQLCCLLDAPIINSIGNTIHSIIKIYETSSMGYHYNFNFRKLEIIGGNFLNI